MGWAIGATFIVMRVVQPFFEIIQLKQMQDKCLQAILPLFTCLAILGLTHVGVIIVCRELVNDEFEEWGKAFLINLLLEIVAWDFVLMPLTLSTLLKCKKDRAKYFSKPL